MAQLNELTEGMSSFYQHTLKRVEQLIFTKVPEALFFASDAQHEKNRIASGVAKHHSKLRKVPSPPSVVEGVEVRDVGARTGREAIDSKPRFSGGRADHPFVMVTNFTNFEATPSKIPRSFYKRKYCLFTT